MNSSDLPQTDLSSGKPASPGVLPDPKLYTGRVIMGYDTPGPDVLTIQEIEGKRHKPVWDELTEKEYIGRCRDKAQTIARDIISQAMAKAEIDAEAIRETARQEMAQAVAEARQKAYDDATAEYTAEYNAMALTLHTLLGGIQGLGNEVWQSRRRDFVTLAKGFTEKALRVEMDQRRADILGSLMDEAVARLDAHREFVLKVAPQDFELAADLIETVKAQRPDLGQWRLVTDASLVAGGVVLETSDLLCDNGLESRLALITPVLDQLDLSEDRTAAAQGTPPHDD